MLASVMKPYLGAPRPKLSSGEGYWPKLQNIQGLPGSLNALKTRKRKVGPGNPLNSLTFNKYVTQKNVLLSLFMQHQKPFINVCQLLIALGLNSRSY